jgi:hypothetical protein
VDWLVAVVVVAGFWGDGFSEDNWGSGWEKCCLCLGLGLYGSYEIRCMRRVYVVCIAYTVRLEDLRRIVELAFASFQL